MYRGKRCSLELQMWEGASDGRHVCSCPARRRGRGPIQAGDSLPPPAASAANAALLLTCLFRG